jgi:nondiscriminating glutamyl-tRNA synthetase
MSLKADIENGQPAANQFSGEDVAAILRERQWLSSAPQPECDLWLATAAALLGPHAADRHALADLLSLIFQYDARAIQQSLECHSVMARHAARDVIRLLANLTLDGPEVDSDRFKQIVSTLKQELNCGGRELFHPIRLSLAGRAGEGELDRVILLLDSAAVLPFRTPVKGTRLRMLEFCSALD